jgi:hypothetical protein
MTKRKYFAVLLLGAAISFGLTSGPSRAQDTAAATQPIDSYSMNYGQLWTYAAVVSNGSKQIAILWKKPPELAALMPAAETLTKQFGLRLYPEPELIVTDLFPVEGPKEDKFLLIYKDPAALDEYLSLKREKEQLIKAGQYTGKVREDIAKRWGRLLGYPESRIDSLLKKNMPHK